MTAVAQISDQEFQSVVKQGTGAVLVEFWQSDCGPCVMFAPLLERFARERDDLTILGYRIDGRDRDRRLWKREGVVATPTLVLYVDGQEVWRTAGMRSMGELRSSIDAAGLPPPPAVGLSA
jgi:thioredoxin 1